MKKTIAFLLFILGNVLGSTTAFASHSLGGELSYTHISGNTYNVRFTFYRDCQGLSAPPTFNLGVNSSCYPAMNLSMTAVQGGTVLLSPACASLATSCNGGTYPGIEKHVYSATVQLQGVCSDWVFSVVECCRNGAITNINLPSSQVSYYSAMLNNVDVAYNNSPRFAETPVFIVNIGATNQFNNAALDDNRDSLITSLTDALVASGTAVDYKPGYSGINPVSPVSSMSVNPTTGDVVMLPGQQEADVIAYKVEEYRNGILIGYVTRDILVSSVASTNHMPVLLGPNGSTNFSLNACAGDTVNFYLTSNDFDAMDSTSIELIGADFGSGVTVTSLPNISPSGGLWDSVNIQVVTSSSMASSTPYRMYLKVSDNNCPYTGSSFYAVDVVLNNCSVNTCSYTYVSDSLNSMLYHFNALNTSPSNLVQWSFGDGSIGSGISVSHTYASSGVYVISMDEIDGNGNLVCSSGGSYFIDPAGPCGINAVDYQNHSYLFQSANQSAGVTATWNFGDGQIGSGTSVYHTFATGGTYSVCLILADANGDTICSNCRMVNDTFNVSNNCLITAQLNGPAAPWVVSFSVPQNPAALSYSWDFGDGLTASGSNPIHTYTQPATYTVCVNVMGGGAIICTSCTTVVIGNPIPNCNALFTSVSNGLTAYFVDQSTTSNSPVNYDWTFGDGASSTARFPQHAYALPGLYIVCLTITDGACSSTWCDSLLVDTLFNITPNCHASFVVTQVAPYQLAVVNLSNGVNLSWNWDFGDGSNSNQPYPSHAYGSTGTYNLCLTVSDATGCSDTFCDTLSVDASGNIMRSQTGFTINVMSPSMLSGVNDVEDDRHRFVVFPNPFNNEIHLKRQDNITGTMVIRLLSLQGAEVFRRTVDQPEVSISSGQLASGTYLLEFSEPGGYPVYQRVIKE